MSVTWQEDWETFIDTVAAIFRSGVTDDELADRFAGGVVRWTGVINNKERLDRDPPMVDIAQPKKDMDLGGGRIVDPGGFLLQVPAHAIPTWQKLPVGTRVTFTARLGAKGSPFPPIEILELTSTETVVMVSPIDGVPV